MKRKKRILFISIVILLVLGIIFTIFYFFSNNKEVKMIDLSMKTIAEIEEFAKNNKLELIIEKENNGSVPKDYVIRQSIEKGAPLENQKQLIVYISLGKIGKDEYIKYGVNELGRVPIMMYHGIHNVKSADTAYTGGNVDKAGYQRTAEAFRNDLEFYYSNGYRMIRLNDYINGIIDVPLGKSPIILTFDDGLVNNFKVNGIDDNGNLIIDSNCAIGILEEFKRKYPDFNVTATFFLNGELFQQSEYNKRILEWLVNNGYDVGNHSYSHADFTTIDGNRSQVEIGRMYQKLEEIIPGKYVNIVALPFGSPYEKKHSNFQYILEGKYNDFSYKTDSTLRVGWESELSPFSKNFDRYFLKRIRAYDNNGVEFDIEMNFKSLNKNRYVSDGNKNRIVVPNDSLKYVNEELNLEVITY